MATITYEQAMAGNEHKYPNLPTREELVEALRRSKPTANQRNMLVAHYFAPERSATAGDLARLCGQSGHAVANLIYGGLAAKLCRLLDRKYDYHLRILAVLHGWPGKAGGVLWIMHPQAAEALEELGWVAREPMEEQDWLDEFRRESMDAIKLTADERKRRLAAAPRLPQQVAVTRREFKRNPLVIAEVLSRAGGRCEDCNREAPFLRRSDGSPYLEVHHEITLAEGGEDTVDNAVALCPNCHRLRHHG